MWLVLPFLLFVLLTLFYQKNLMPLTIYILSLLVLLVLFVYVIREKLGEIVEIKIKPSPSSLLNDEEQCLE